MMIVTKNWPCLIASKRGQLELALSHIASKRGQLEPCRSAQASFCTLFPEGGVVWKIPYFGLLQRSYLFFPSSGIWPIQDQCMTDSPGRFNCKNF